MPVTPMRYEGKRRSRDAGMTLLELLVVIVILGIVVATAWTIIVNTIPMVRADSALQDAVSQLRQARFSAVDQRRNYIVTFQGTNEILVQRQEINPNTGLATVKTNEADIFLPPGVVYMTFAGVPDTPDAFGNTGSVNFNCSGNTTPCSITFQSDGEVLPGANPAPGTAPIDGTLFMGTSGNKTTARAVTIMGATGRVKGFRYTGTAWSN